MAPIDPLQLLKALSPLLSAEGGIKSIEEVTRLSSLMKKFSRKLVSRCVYVNVLRASKQQDIDAFLQKGGWETIHQWLQETKNSDNTSFLIELLELYKVLPMTVDRLKENNSAKIIKSLSKSSNTAIKTLASEVVESWVKLVKGDSANSVAPAAKTESAKDKAVKKKKRKEGVKRVSESSPPTPAKKSSPAGKATATEQDDVECLEDVKLPDYIRTVVADVVDITKVERKPTVKTYRSKMRSIGLDEPTPLPKPVSKKAAAKDSKPLTVPPLKLPLKRIGAGFVRDLTPPPPKKLKPPMLQIPKPPEATTTAAKSSDSPKCEAPDRREIKLIPARPKPAVHVLTESAGFMDALVAGPVPPLRKKKKSSPKPTTPPSPVTAAPKLQFYKDTLETQEDNSEKEDAEAAVVSGEESEPTSLTKEESSTSRTNEVNSETVDKHSNTLTPASPDATAEDSPSQQIPPGHKRKKKRKSVSWANENNLRQVYYFELDETERVNVNNMKNFVDMKTLERLNERHAVESARRMMEEMADDRMTWVAILVDLPPPLITPGCNSAEREVQRQRELTVLQEIFFSKDSIPDAPHEPDLETVEAEEPKVIPLEDENNPDAVIDYSMMEPPPPVTTLPPALSNLVMSLAGKGAPYNTRPSDNEITADTHGFNPQPVIIPGLGELPPPPMMNHAGPHGYDVGYQGPDYGGGPMGPMMGNMGMMGMGGPNMGMGGGPPMDFYGGPRGMMHNNMQQQHMGGQGGPPMRPMGPGRGGGPMRGGGRGPHPRGGQQNHQWGGRGFRGDRGNNGGGGRGNRPACRHFMAGSCKYQDSCKYLHPGVNGPPL